MNGDSLRSVPSLRLRWIVGLIGVPLLAALICVGAVSRYALLTVLVDGVRALFVVGPACLLGIALTPLVCPRSLPGRWQALLGAALGLGGMSLLVLSLGLAGCLQRTFWIAILGLCCLAGAVRLIRVLRESDTKGRAAAGGVEDSTPRALRYAWLLVYPFLVLALLAAATAPGFLWQEEGFGYDVLEYHLALPKEYFLSGRIEHIPHNVYASFPANVEMLYLLAMVIVSQVQEAGTVAQMIHLCFAGLTVFAAWVAGREWSRGAGIIAGVTLATTGWLTYLSGLAYVENGMLFFGMAATAVWLRLCRANTDPNKSPSAEDGPSRERSYLREASLAGALAGFACGCKYTALPMLAIPLGLSAFLWPGVAWGRKAKASLVFFAGALATFAPWLIKNQVMTGNPVFPLANTVFQANPPGWGPEQTQRWNRAHATPPEQQSLSGRLGLLWKHVLWDKEHRIGPAIIVLALGGLIGRRRTRVDGILVALVGMQLAVWLFATHLFARFAVMLLIPLALLAGRAALDAGGRRRWRLVGALVIVGAAWNFTFAAGLQARHAPMGAAASWMYEGRMPGYEYLAQVNLHLPEDAKVLLVGDAKAFYFRRAVDYSVVFNQNPFAHAVRTAASAGDVIAWLQSRAYTHVLVNWSEVERLSATYGFSPRIDPSTFDLLVGAGLTLTHSYPHPTARGRYVELFEVPR